MYSRRVLALPLVISASVLGIAVNKSVGSKLPRHLNKGTCWNDGTQWGQEENLALELADTACRDNFTTGHYARADVRVACYNLGNSGNRVNFEIHHLYPEEQSISLELCKDMLRMEIIGCSTGGLSLWDNWTAGADPNSGHC